jgi:hypothetical protein
MRFWALSLALIGCGSQGAPPALMAPAVVAQAGIDGAAPRRVIDTVTLDLRVQNVQDTASQLTSAVSAASGYVADSQVQLSLHTGRWTVQIPSERLESFLAASELWGVVLSSRTTAEDVTEQFIDVEARQAAKRVEEERLLKLLQEGTGSLADVLAVEQQLQRVRQEIEQATGKLRYLEHATRYATVHITAYELPGVTWSDGGPLWKQAGSVFLDSWRVLQLCGRAAVLIVAAITPWLIVATVPLAPAWWYWRRRYGLVTVEVRETGAG